MMNKKKYDVIIIGGGVGGLICGTYLAKNGKTVLILEKNTKPGGYCQSFERDEFVFDAGPHIIGGCNKGGLLYRILEELEIDSRFKKSRFADRYRFGNDLIEVPQDIKEYKQLLIKRFKDEKDNINRYFKILFSISYRFLNDRRVNKEAKLSYKNFLDAIIRNPDLKCILNAHCGYIGLRPDNLSCLAMAIMEWSYLKEGTYNFVDSSDNFINAILSRFSKYGGEIILNEEAEKIVLAESNTFHSVISRNGLVYWCDKLVINIDPMKFCNCIAQINELGYRFLYYLNKYTFTPSFLLAYIGINTTEEVEFISGWHYNSYSLKDSFYKAYYIHTKTNRQKEKKSIHIIKFYSDKHIKAESTIEVRNKWRNEAIIIFKNDLAQRNWKIKTMTFADPNTLEKLTNNRHGSAYGYSMNVKQAHTNIFNRLLNDRGIYFVGHWSTFGGGIVPVAFSGKTIANTLIQNSNT